MRPPLIFQNSGDLAVTPTAGIGTVPLQDGCRGFTGPVPPPLWIRVPGSSVV